MHPLRSEPSDAAKGTARADRRVAIALGTCFALFYVLLGHGHFSGTDENGVFLTSAALYENMDLAIERGGNVFPGRDGRHYSIFAVGQSVLALPFYALGDVAERVISPAWQSRLFGRGRSEPETAKTFAVGLFAPVASAVLIALFFLMERRLGVTLRSAAISAALLGGTTYVAAMSVFFLRHTLEAIAVLGALYAFRGFLLEGRVRSLAAGSAWASLTLLVRLPMAISGLGLGGYVLYALRHRVRNAASPPVLRVIAALALPAAVALALHGALSLWTWGSWIGWPRLVQAKMLASPMQVGLLGLLASPGSSIFLYSPLLLMLPWSFPALWRKARPESLTILVIVVCSLLLASRFILWHGLWSSPGPRMLFVATPLFMLAIGPWLDSKPSRRALTAAGLLGILGTAVQLPIMAVNWRAVVIAMGYPPYAPKMEFLFDLQMSPILGCAQGLLAGNIDVWLWSLWAGAPGREPELFAALAFTLLWAGVFALALASLTRALRTHPEA